MTWVSGLSDALVRSACIATLAVLLAWPTRVWLARLRGRTRALAWGALVAVYLVPAIIVGYTYKDMALVAQADRASLEALYGGLMLTRLIPLATLVLWLAPWAFSREAMACYSLVAWRKFWPSLRFWLSGPARVPALAFSLVFLFAFGDFELASLLYVKSWTVTIFDSQVGGKPVSESLLLALPAVSCQMAVLLFVGFAFYRTLGFGVGPRTPAGRIEGVGFWAGWAWILVPACALVIAPVLATGARAVIAFALLTYDSAMLREIGASVIFAGIAAVCAWVLAGWFSRARFGVWSGTRAASALVLCVPGLLGGLVLGLCGQWLFQCPGVSHLYDTPIPLAIALTFLLFPFALLLRVLLRATRPGESLHAARMLRASTSMDVRRDGARMVWELQRRGAFWAAALVFWLAYLELSASAILMPTGMTPVSVQLYNQMHFGRIPTLSAIACVAVAAPIALVLTAGMVWRLFQYIVFPRAVNEQQ
jgi:iron(III) transport system permease protein